MLSSSRVSAGIISSILGFSWAAKIGAKSGTYTTGVSRQV
jgi:hypothetical protein